MQIFISISNHIICVIRCFQYYSFGKPIVLYLFLML